MSFRILIITVSLFFNTGILSQEPKLILPVGHSSISTVKYSPDEKKIITSSTDKTNKLWDALTGNLLADFSADEGIFYSGQFSSDNKRILTISGKNAKIWDATTASLLAELKAHEGFLNTAKFSPDGTHVVTVSTDSIIKMWNSEGKRILFSIKEQSYIHSAEFSPDGKKIVITYANGDVNIRDVFTGNIIVPLIGHKGLVWYAEYNSTENKLLTASLDKTVKIWDATTGKLLRDFNGGKLWLVSVHFSPDGKKIITSYADSTGYGIARNRRPTSNGRPVMTKTELKTTIWDTETGHQLIDLKGLTKAVYFSSFSNDGKKILTITENFIANLWDVRSGDLIKFPDLSSLIISTAEFSKDGSKLSAVLAGGIVQIWDLNSGKVLTGLKGHSYNTYTQFSPDRKKIITNPGNNSINIRDAFNGDLLTVLKGHKDKITNAQYSKNGKKIVTSSLDSTVKIWDTDNGELLSTIKTNSPYIYGKFSPDGKKIVSSSYEGKDNTATIWDIETGKLFLKLNGHRRGISSMSFSYDGSKIVTTSYDSTAIVWSVESGEKIVELKGHTSYVYSAEFSPDNKTVLTISLDKTAKIWDVTSGKILADLTAHTGTMSSGHFSPDGKRIATSNEDGTAKIWDAVDGKLLHDLKEHTNLVRPAEFSPSGEKLITISWDETVKIWDVASGKLLSDLKGYNSNILSADFYMDETKVMTSTADNMCRVWDIRSGKILYSLIGIDSTDFLVVDNQYRFDGTEAARKLLYFTCGTEIIELEQVKDQLWVPNLAQRIMAGDSINARKLSDLNICNLTPLVDVIDQTALQYQFEITPRLGGLGISTIYVNGIEVKKYTPSQLKKQNGKYLLSIEKKELSIFFTDNRDNEITVKALTATNSISSRSAAIQGEKNTTTTAPNLYAIIVGVSNYKGEGLDLKYAAKDAVDFGSILNNTARKLLNVDGKEHVFISSIHTDTGYDKFPEKNSIRQVFTDIGNKAMPNDILVVFFAGHGVLDADKNLFYFLTADASHNTVHAALKDVGISTEEITEWIKPQVMKAQKRILIFDACNSGQVINEMVSIGKKDQGFIAARNDDKSKQIKAIEKLNERSGMFILSASSSNQKAYEIGKYNQGVLTYSLLKAVKEQPDILDDGQYLNISRWFNAAEKIVGTMTRETGGKQQPQIVSTSNFNIGIVDEEVKDKIVLPFEKPLLTRSEFRNSALRVDNLKLRALVDRAFSTLSETNNNSSFLFDPEFEGSRVYSLSCDYTVTGNDLTISGLLLLGGTDIKCRFEIKGFVNDLNSLVAAITDKITHELKN